MPTVLLIFNAWDPCQMFATENHDFEFAMYGALTVSLDRSSGKIVDSYHDKGKSLQPKKNTSISALARLYGPSPDGSVKVTLFENIHAKNQIDYDSLPTCFELVRATYG